MYHHRVSINFLSTVEKGMQDVAAMESFGSDTTARRSYTHRLVFTVCILAVCAARSLCFWFKIGSRTRRRVLSVTVRVCRPGGCCGNVGAAECAADSLALRDNSQHTVNIQSTYSQHTVNTTVNMPSKVLKTYRFS